MEETSRRTPFLEKLAAFLVDKRNLIFFLYLCAIAFCSGLLGVAAGAWPREKKEE